MTKRTLLPISKKIILIVLSCIVAACILLTYIAQSQHTSDDSINSVERLYSNLSSSLDKELVNNLHVRQTYEEIDKWYREVKDNIQPSVLDHIEYKSIQTYKPLFGNTTSLNLRILPIYLDKKIAFEVRAINKNGELIRVSPFNDYKIEKSSGPILITDKEKDYYINQINLYTKIRINTLEGQLDILNAEMQDAIADCEELLLTHSSNNEIMTEYQLNRRASCKDKVNVFSLAIDEQKTESEILNSSIASNMESDPLDQMIIEYTIESYFSTKNTLERYQKEGILADDYIDNYKNILKTGTYTNDRKSFMQPCNTFELLYYNSDYPDASPEISYNTCA